MCILPGKRTHPYGEIKRISDTVLGIPTQCVQGSHTRRPNPQYIANVCLVLPVIGEAPTIVFGADVSHPAPGETGKPSICAVVASIDQHATSYVSAGKG
jgi:eukaryotic translation initiation factor 2C